MSRHAFFAARRGVFPLDGCGRVHEYFISCGAMDSKPVFWGVCPCRAAACLASARDEAGAMGAAFRAPGGGGGAGSGLSAGGAGSRIVAHGLRTGARGARWGEVGARGASCVGNAESAQGACASWRPVCLPRVRQPRERGSRSEAVAPGRVVNGPPQVGATSVKARPTVSDSLP